MKNGHPGTYPVFSTAKTPRQISALRRLSEPFIPTSFD
jgi:hypothetical protein